MHVWLYESITLNVYHVNTAYEEKQMLEKLQGGYTVHAQSRILSVRLEV